MFRNSVKLYVYPMRPAAYERYVAAAIPRCIAAGGGVSPSAADAAPPACAAEVLITADNIQVPPHLRHLYIYLFESHDIESVTGFNQGTLDIISRDVLAKIKNGDPTWELAVPAAVAELVKQRGLFDYRAPPAEKALSS